MKKSFVKLTATTAAALVLAGAAMPAFAAEDTNFSFSTEEQAAAKAAELNAEEPKTAYFVEQRGDWFVVVYAAPEVEVKDPTENQGQEGTENQGQESEELNLEGKQLPEGEPVNAPGAQVAAFEAVPRVFNTLKEAKEAFPEAFVMAENGQFIVYTDGQDLVQYEYATLAEAKNAFPEAEVYAENGKFYVWSDHLPLKKYEFETLRDAKNAFPEAEPMAENGKFYVWSNELPLRAFVFNTLEDALKAFPGSNPMAMGGQFYVYSKYQPLVDADSVEFGDEGNADAAATKVEGRNQASEDKEGEKSEEEVKSEDKEDEKSEEETKSEDEKAEDKEAEKSEDKKEVKVEKEAKKAEETLPETGEASSFAVLGASMLAALSGAALLFRRNRSN